MRNIFIYKGNTFYWDLKAGLKFGGNDGFDNSSSDIRSFFGSY